VWVASQQRCICVLEPFSGIATSISVFQSMLFLGGQQGQIAAYSTLTWQLINSVDDVRTKGARLIVALLYHRRPIAWLSVFLF
jgi:hypothetical protein